MRLQDAESNEKAKSKKSKYKSDIIKKRKQRLLGEAESALDELKQSIVLTNQKMQADVALLWITNTELT